MEHRTPASDRLDTLVQLVALICVAVAVMAQPREPEPRPVSAYERDHGPGVMIVDANTGIECQVWPAPYASNEQPHRECRLP